MSLVLYSVLAVTLSDVPFPCYQAASTEMGFDQTSCERCLPTFSGRVPEWLSAGLFVTVGFCSHVPGIGFSADCSQRLLVEWVRRFGGPTA